jgi:hypothetical protein
MWIAKSNMAIVQKCHYQSFGNHNSENNKDAVADLVQSYTAIGCHMSLDVHLLDSHLDVFLEYPTAVINEYGQRFHQDISTMEKRYHGTLSPSMLADYCWTLRRKVPQAKCIRTSCTVTFWWCIYCLYYRETEGTRWRSGWGSALETGWSRDWFLMVTFKFFIEIILSAALGSTQPPTELSTRNIFWG